MKFNMLNKPMVSIMAGIVTALFSQTAVAQVPYDWTAVGRVKIIEATYMPSDVPFTLDVAAGSCAPGSMLSYKGWSAGTDIRRANIQAVYTLLLSAKLSGTPIQIFGVGCEVRYIHLVQ